MSHVTLYLLVVIMAFGLFSCSVGIVLPVYSTFKAIEKKDQNEQQKWLLYWAGWDFILFFQFFPLSPPLCSFAPDS